jgi:hypothetical protein
LGPVAFLTVAFLWCGTPILASIRTIWKKASAGTCKAQQRFFSFDFVFYRIRDQTPDAAEPGLVMTILYYISWAYDEFQSV